MLEKQKHVINLFTESDLIVYSESHLQHYNIVLRNINCNNVTLFEIYFYSDVFGEGYIIVAKKYFSPSFSAMTII